MEANLPLAAFAGCLGGILMTALIYILKSTGRDLDIPYILGSYFITTGDTFLIYLTGIFSHVLASACWGMLYVFLLVAMAVPPTWIAGILWGFAHGIFTGVLMGTLKRNHPKVGEDKPLDDPGILGRRWSKKMPYWVLGLHVIYGASTLFFYQLLQQA